MAILFLLGVVFQFIYFPFVLTGDGLNRFNALVQFMKTGVVEDQKYSLIGPILSYPLALLDNGGETHYWILRYNFFLLCITAAVLFILLKRYLAKRTVMLFLVFLFFASMFPGHIIHYYGEVFTALVATVGIVLIETKRELFAWPLMALSVANTPATIVPLAGICLYYVIREKKLAYVVLPILALAIAYGEAQLKSGGTSNGFMHYLRSDMGNITVLPYSSRPGFSYPMWLGILGLLFSFGKGVLFFAPGLLFVPYLMKRMKETVVKRIFLLWVLYLIGLIFVYSKWWAWYGGWFWGPRFLLFTSIPASFALSFVLTDAAAKRTIKIIALLFVLWSLWVGISGAIVGQRDMDICLNGNYAYEFLCVYVPEYSVLFRPFIMRPPLGPVGWVYVAYSFIIWLCISVKVFCKKKKSA